MMHLALILMAIAIAGGLRLSWNRGQGSYPQRWQHALTVFLAPILLLIMTALAVVWMGPAGQMVCRWEGWLTYGLACGFLGVGVVSGLKLAIAGWRSVQQARAYPPCLLAGYPTRVLDTPALFSAQVGFWQPELVVSQGLVDSLDGAHLQAVLVHEQGHHHYRDTFWFFWLGWLRRLTAWLPYTGALWEELMLLREIRADQWAAQQIDSLILAESLLQVVEAPLLHAEVVSAAFSCIAPRDRLTERINALLSESEPLHRPTATFWLGLILTALPLIAVPFHH